MTPVLLSFGHGYSARALARILLPQGWQVIGTTRDPDKMAAIAATGAEPLLWRDQLGDQGHDPGADDFAAALARATHLLVSAEPGPAGDALLARERQAIAARAPGLDWVGYLSTTGVYGDRGGDWVDEDSDLRPARGRSTARAQAEAAWRAIAGLPVHVFRLAGIYGPGRGPFARLRAGTARRIVKPGQIFSRIHVDDIARVLAASIARPNPGRIYNLCDDLPAPNPDVIAEAARLIGIDPPPEEDFATADLTPMARSFYLESRRVRNDRIHDELGVRLLYPDYHAGLRALLAAGE